MDNYNELTIDDEIMLEDILELEEHFKNPFEAILFLYLSKTSCAFWEMDFFNTASEKMFSKTFLNATRQFFKKYQELPIENKADQYLTLLWKHFLDIEQPTIIEKALGIRKFIEQINPQNNSLDDICIFVEDFILGRNVLTAHKETEKSQFHDLSWEQLHTIFQKEQEYSLSLGHMDNVQKALDQSEDISLEFKKLPTTQKDLMNSFSVAVGGVWFLNLMEDLNYSIEMQSKMESYPNHTHKAFYYVLNQFLFKSIDFINEIKTSTDDDFEESVLDISAKINRLFYLTMFENFDEILDDPIVYHTYNFLTLRTEFEDAYYDVSEELKIDYDFLETFISNFYPALSHYELLVPFKHISWVEFFAYETILGNFIDDDNYSDKGNVVLFRKKPV